MQAKLNVSCLPTVSLITSTKTPSNKQGKVYTEIRRLCKIAEVENDQEEVFPSNLEVAGDDDVVEEVAGEESRDEEALLHGQVNDTHDAV